MMKRKMMALAAIPVAAVLAGGGVAVAQAAGNPAGTAVVQQVSAHHNGDLCHGHQVTRGTPVAGVPARHDGDHGNRGDHGACSGEHAEHGQPAQVSTGVMAHAHHGEDHGAHHGDE
jgi:hypothetical protein